MKENIEDGERDKKRKRKSKEKKVVDGNVSYIR